ncbi:alpha-L-fucosidase [Coraliomargarita sp. SDUM461004]|uniref:alpha-L-fucosidase n=1 Tax=Thalassobacterium sedimentorum TaxID=3041258 RepID=A0ABU1AFJ3_9BACT|nr:alpha-L-fucosidase [Coraliomargarita sp. SDUM461004]MDQ8192888.1 alpha-L-fucosidase [Coraliomargarita sp. SDUM461004]
MTTVSTCAPLKNGEDFAKLRYGMFIHYGLYSLLERGEWVMNRERIPSQAMRKLAERFTADKFNADEICKLAIRGGMRYIILTSMHHEAFCLYKTETTDFNSWNYCQRDLVDELIVAARKHGLYVGMYHSLNDWFHKPDAVDALEDKDAYDQFIERTHHRVEELVRNYDFDILWYDGWWPYDGDGWQGEEMNAKLRKIRPNLLFNPRNGAEGDFCTPEQHMSAPRPWQPWEGCMTLNEHWGYHKGDDMWKSPKEVIHLLCTAASGKGNLLLNIGPKGDGSIPQASVEIIEAVGKWKASCGEALENTDLFTFALETRDDHRGDWCSQGPMTVSGNKLYVVMTSWADDSWGLAGLNAHVESAELLPSGVTVQFEQNDDNTVRFFGLPPKSPTELAPVLRVHCDRPPTVYNCGGMRIPKVPHPPYDPLPSDVAL